MSWNRDTKWDPPAESVIREALFTELGRLGIPTTSERGRADAVLRSALTMCELGMPDSNIPSASLGLQVALQSPSGQPLWETTITGEGNGHHAWLDAGVAETALSRALASIMGQLGSLIETQDVLEKISSRPPAAAAPARPAAAEPAAIRSDIDEPPAASPARRKAHAVVIGVRRYQQPLPEADFADSDARLVGRYLAALGYPDANVATLIGEQATKSAFEKYIEGWLPNRVEGGDEVFVYFSGHGAPNPRTGDAYLVPYDGDPTYLDKTGYPLKRLYTELAKLPARSVTVVMDSCFSGAGGRSVLAKGARPLVSVSAVEGVPARLTVLTAGAGDQISYAYQEKGHGLFTYFLLRALKGQGGRLDLKAAFDAGAPQVTSTARREYNADQVPQWNGKP